MKKTAITALLLIAGLTAMQAQLLWKVSGNKLKHTSYIFGTHHLIPISFLDSVPGLYKAFNSCDEVVGEMVLNSVDATAKIQQAALLPNHIQIKDLLSDSDYLMVDKELQSVMKLSLKDVSIMNPALILNLYEIAIYKKATGYSDDTQSDSYFQLVANEKDKKVIGLETVDQQIKALFGNGSLERLAEILVQTIRNKDSIVSEMLNMNKLYKSGKINELMELSQHKGNVVDMTEEEYANLVNKRNSDWLLKLPDMFKTSSCFVAVGALHLGGKEGLIEGLKQEGYKVTPVEEIKDSKKNK